MKNIKNVSTQASLDIFQCLYISTNIIIESIEATSNNTISNYDIKFHKCSKS